MSRNQLPTVGELQQLTDAFRRDPASAFVRLGNCLLDLGRPQEAIDVASNGLRANPNDLQGRLLLGTALSQLHRWKDAQAELLKVVKTDRNNGQGFRLLGEVLMRRNDFERALPVLQHAQNLNPSDSLLLALVRRARDGQQLDPPPPIPMAMQPLQSGAQGGRGGALDDEAATFVAGELGGMRQAPALARVDLQQREVRGNAAPPPSHRVAARVENDRRSSDDLAFGAIEHHAVPPPEDPLAPMASHRSGRTSAPPPPPGGMGGAPVRPRVIPAEKPKDAAQAGLRTSAAAGEQYLNQLLMGGLLDVPNVRVSEAKYDVAAGKRWGRSSLRMFIYLFVMLLAAGAGSGVWYWYSNKQMSADIARYLDSARLLVDSGDRADLAMATEEAKKALERDTSDVYSMAMLAETTSLATLLYGEYAAPEVQRGVDSVARTIKDPSAKGYRELVIAQAALGLAQLPELAAADADADGRLAKIRADLKSWLERSPDDHLARWLLGRAHLAAGDRSEAFAALAKAHANGEGPAIATVDLANFHVDAGEYETGMALFESALSRSNNHQLAFVGRSLARSERRVEAQEAMADISIGLAQAQGSKLMAWKELALASAQAALEDYEASNAALDKAEGPEEPRFLARVGLYRIGQGRIVDAAKIRGQIRWYAADPEPHPLVMALDAELLLARGLPSEALEAIGDLAGVRAESIRGRALFDLGRTEEALGAFEKALDQAPENLEAKVWVEGARMIATTGDSRRNADEALDSLGRKATTKTARFVHGTALAAVGNPSLAKDKLEQSVTDVTAAFPNPLAYRSHLALARLAYSEGKIADATAQLDKASEINPGYLPTLDLEGQVLVESDAAKALGILQDVINAGAATVGGELAYGRALAKTGGDRGKAVETIRRAQERGADVPSLQKAIADVDPALFDELGVPPPADK